MSARFPGDPRVFALAVVGGLVAFAGQSCDGRTKERDGVQPGTAAGANGDGADASSTSDEVVAGGADRPPGAPRLCGAGGEACPAGFVCCPQCCLANLPPVCQPATDAGCPLPDLSVDVGALATKTYLETIDGTPCEVEEGCLGGPGKRRVLRFDVQVPNRGVADLVLGNPDAGGPFEYATCHKHYHFTGFAHYRLVADDSDKVVLLGRKQAFCARDSARVDRAAPFNARYDCGLQGIQVGWSDIYDPSLPCQFLDVTDVPSGTYRLEVEVNPDRTMTELRYDNNLASVRIKIP
ncbi:MAG: hypothetical protein KF795_05560 [Labilithrix sp.]|nr:hypothetical protein [Labilithrix sp.]